MALRYGNSPKSGTSYTAAEQRERGVKKLLLYAHRDTWEGIDALKALWGVNTPSAVIRELVARAMELHEKEISALPKEPKK